MKNLFFALGLVMLCSAGFAQTDATSIPKLSVTGKSFLQPITERDTFPLNKNFDSILPYNGIPNKITVKPVPPVYKGNNQQGFAIYESQLDKMSILVPDSGFQSAMPNPFAAAQKSRDSILTSPRRIPDFLYKKQWQPKVYKQPDTSIPNQ